MRWKPQFSVLFLLVLVTTAACCFAYARQQFRPELYVEAPVIDAGTVQPGKIHQATFVIANRGGREIELQPGREPCCCGFASRQEVLLLPGNQVEMVVEWCFPANCRGAEEELKYIVRSDHPLTPELELTVVSRVP